jgi:hypothetical protein
MYTHELNFTYDRIDCVNPIGIDSYTAYSKMYWGRREPNLQRLYPITKQNFDRLYACTEATCSLEIFDPLNGPERYTANYAPFYRQSYFHAKMVRQRDLQNLNNLPFSMKIVHPVACL